MHLLPLQPHRLADAQAVPMGKQDHGGVAVPMAALRAHRPHEWSSRVALCGRISAKPTAIEAVFF
jgi:hypothetical protein